MGDSKTTKKLSIFVDEKAGIDVYEIHVLDCFKDPMRRAGAALRSLPRVDSPQDAQGRAVFRPLRLGWCSTKRGNLTLGKSYTYSGQTSPGVALSEVDGMTDLAKELGAHFGVTFSMVHCNRFTDDGMLSWHADDETDLDAGQPIVCVSWGKPMRLQFRRSPTTAEPKPKVCATYLAKDMSIYVMDGGTQRAAQHRVNTALKKQLVGHENDPCRISATFRVTG